MQKYSTEKVYTVSDLKTVNSFTLFERNRDIDENHAKKIKNAILRGEDVGTAEIELRTLKIIDGQHRLEALRQVLEEGGQGSINIVFKDFRGNEDAAMEYAHSLNAYQKGWTDKNYLAYYKPKIDVYRKLEEFASNNSLCYNIMKSGKNKGKKNLKLTTAARLVMGPNFQRSAIKEGKFNATDEDFLTAVDYHNEIRRILQIKGYVTEEKNLPNMGNSFEAMITAWINFRNATWRQMEKIGGFDAYCLRIPHLNMEVCTNIKEWYNRFNGLLQTA